MRSPSPKCLLGLVLTPVVLLLEPLNVRNPDAKSNRVYQTEIRICNDILPSVAVKRFNRLRTRAKRLASVKPCELPKGKSMLGMPTVADHPANGWDIGSLRR